ncbi:MAG: efflux RND transporter permease subunit, partial [Spirochaetota bacterium]
LIKEVTSIINVEDITGENDTLKTYPLIEEKNGKIIIPNTQKELDLLRNRIDNNEKLFKAHIVSSNTNENGTPKALNIIINAKESDEGYEKLINTLRNTIQEIEKKTNAVSKGYKTYLFGEPYTSNEMNKQSQKDAFSQVFLVILVICIIYFINFRSGIGVLFPLLTNIISTIWVFSLMGYFNIKLSIVGLLILPLLLAVASSYGIHTLNQYYKEAHTFTKKNKNKQIAISISHILGTITLAGLTTVVGIFSLTTSSIVHLRTFGIFASIGVCCAVILSLIFIPALLSLVKLPKKEKAVKFNTDISERIIEKLILFTIKNKYVVFIFILALILTGIVGIFFITTDSSSGEMFNKGHQVRILSDYFSENFDGVSNMTVVIDTNPDYENSVRNEIKKIQKKAKNNNEINYDIINENNKDEAPTDTNTDTNTNEENNDEQDPFSSSVFDTDEDNTNQTEQDPFSDNIFDEDISGIDLSEIEENPEHNKALSAELLKKIEKLSNYAVTIDGVGRCYSFADIQKRFHYVMNNNDPEYKKIPDKDSTIREYIEVFSGEDENQDGLADAFETFIDPTMNKLRINMNLKNIGENFISTEDIKNIRAELSKYIEKEFDTSKIDYYISGSSILYMSIQNKIVSSQFVSVCFSLIVIFILTSLLFKSLKIGLLSLIPLTVGVLINFGIMGYADISLNTATSLISAFAIGIGVDDTIHFILNLRRELKHNNKNKDTTEIIYNTLKKTSKAIVFTSLALIFGFIVVIFSSFIPVRHFSILVSITMVNATVATLMFLPSIILIFPGLIKSKFNPDNKHHK